MCEYGMGMGWGRDEGRRCGAWSGFNCADGLWARCGGSFPGGYLGEAYTGAAAFQFGLRRAERPIEVIAAIIDADSSRPAVRLAARAGSVGEAPIPGLTPCTYTTAGGECKGVYGYTRSGMDACHTVAGSSSAGASYCIEEASPCSYTTFFQDTPFRCEGEIKTAACVPKTDGRGRWIGCASIGPPGAGLLASPTPAKAGDKCHYFTYAGYPQLCYGTRGTDTARCPSAGCSWNEEGADCVDDKGRSGTVVGGGCNAL